MYTIQLGQVPARGDVLQEAITHVLKLERLTVFPTGTWTINQLSFDRLVALILQRATEMLPREQYPLFSIGEAGAALVTRGYKPGALPKLIAPTPDVAPAYSPTAGEPEQDSVAERLYEIQPVTDIKTAWEIYKKPDPAHPITLYPTVAPIVTKIGPPAEEAFIAAQNTSLPERTRQPGPITTPIVIPPPPSFPEILPPVVAESKSNKWLWIAGILALYVLGREDRPHPTRRRKKRKTMPVAGSLSGLEGDIANTLLWQEIESEKTGGLIWRAMKQGPACAEGQPCRPETFRFQTRTCVERKQVPNTSKWFLKNSLTRCAKYQRVCATSCIPEPMAKPDASPGHGLNVNRMVRGLAKQMADDKNDMEETLGKALGREILDGGGLRPYKGDKSKEEFAVVPLFMRRKEGQTLDEMAQEMGFEDDTALLEAIRKEYPGIKKTKRRYSAEDFKLQAEGMVWTAIEAGQASGLGQTQKDLFPALRRELALEHEDLSTSDDPLEMHLERKGWKLSRVRDLQDSIAEKMVPDLFTGKTKPLSRGEKELQRDIQEFLDSAIPVSTRYPVKCRAADCGEHRDWAPYGAFWFNVVKGGTKVRRIPNEAIGAEFGKYLSAGTGRSYLVFNYGQQAAEKELTQNLQRIREMRKKYGGGFISDSPTAQTLRLPGRPKLSYHVQPVADYEAFTDFTRGHNVKDLVTSRLMTAPAPAPYRSQPKLPGLSGVGGFLAAANALYSLAKMVVR